HVGFRYAADLYNTKVTNIEVSTIAGVPIIELKKTPLDGWGRIAKRTGDIVLAFIGMIVLSPFFLLIALVIRLDSRGPVFVRLPRVGESGRLFHIVKFRSMIAGAHAMKSELLEYNERKDGPLFKMKNDPRVTRIGRMLRRTSIDELPNLMNVLTGQMSLVGPRPHEPEEVKRYERHERKLLSIRPGITGMAQVSGRADLSFAEEVQLDTFYIENWSPRLDLLIFVRTLMVVIRGRASV
ncbi:MAG: exopolysaccharide biosynthesis polyprenyl glycosylphosphotransferase, partial [Candidatus Kerfeldbacteria bacterium]|nr:exopolysaccharide biosynthesis polyprenyl glycosylphosphotransferase [Candidatus Kerfeldbacteria bacterium]